MGYSLNFCQNNQLLVFYSSSNFKTGPTLHFLFYFSECFAANIDSARALPYFQMFYIVSLMPCLTKTQLMG